VNAINQSKKDGSFLLTLKDTEDFILTNLEQIQFEDIQNANMITLFQRICSSNFNQVLAKIFAHYNDRHDDYFELMLSQNEEDGNNALMKAAISKNEGVLMSLLGFVSISNHKDKYLERVLHLKNKNHQTVLKIIASQGQGIQFYQVTMISNKCKKKCLNASLVGSK
jgi:hypothetical protein